MTTSARRLLLELLSAAGHPVPVVALRDIDELTDFTSVLTEAERDDVVAIDEAGLVTLTPDGDTAVGSLGGMRTATLRSRLGALLTGRPAVPDDVVAHHRLAGLVAVPDDGAVLHAIRVADAALLDGELHTAAELFEATLTALDHGAEPATARVEALSGLATTLAWIGRGDEAQHLLVEATDEAIRSGEATQLASVALVWAGRSITVDDDPANTALIDQALHAIERERDRPPAHPDGAGRRFDVLTAQLLGLRADRTVFTDLVAAQRLADDAVERARATGDADTIIGNLFAKRLTIWHPSTHRECLALAAEMVALAPRSEHRREYGGVARLQVFLEQGDFEHFDSELRSMQRRVEHRRGRFERVWVETMLGARALVRGLWADVDAHASAARRLTAGFDYEVLEQLLIGQQMVAAWHTGADLTGLVGSDVIPAGPMRAAWTACLLGLTSDQLSPDVVERELVRHLADGVAGIRRDLTWGPVVACLSMAATTARSTEHARQLADAIEPVADQWAATGGAIDFGPFAWHLARLWHVLGRRDDALELLDATLERCLAAHADPWTARVRLSIATASERRCEAEATAALAIAARLGMPAVVDAAERLLTANRRRDLPAGLTEREAEVLSLVAEGHTNKDIAAQLFLSVKTVERHLLNSYSKIGVRNRSEATAFMLRHGLART